MERGMSNATLSDIYEQIADLLATARTKQLTGEEQDALGLFQEASLLFTRFRDVLSTYGGFAALEHALAVTMTALQNGPAVDAVRAKRAPRRRRRIS